MTSARMTDRPISDALDLPATSVRLRTALDAIGASAAVRRAAFDRAAAPPTGEAWRRFLSQALLLLGAGLLLAGIVCFFAFNWEVLGRFAKLLLLQAAIVACAVVGWWRLPGLTGRVALSGASVLVGPLLGVFGQSYQTGADPWGLFAAWALLILPWVIVSQFSALWLFFIALGDAALALFWTQVLEADGATWRVLFLLLAAIHLIAVAAWELQYRRAQPWLDERWAPRLVLAGLFGFLLVPGLDFLFNFSEGELARTIGFGALLAAIVLTFLVYRLVREDLFMLTVAGGSALIVLTTAVGRFLFEGLDAELGGMLFMAIFVIAEVALAVYWLRRSVRGAAE